MGFCLSFSKSRMTLFSPKKRIAITGYGPFGGIEQNPSQVIVERLANTKIDGVELLTEIIPVAYEDAERCSTKLCMDVKPDFIIHIGVSGEWEDCIQLEQQSFSHGYWGADVDGKVPFLNCSCVEVKNDVPKILKTNLNCEKIIKALDAKYEGEELCFDTSENPGRFLCAYIYYASLAQYNGKALFIHVPKFIDTVSTPETLTKGIVDIIKEVAKQI